MTGHPWSGGFRSLEEEHDEPIAEVDGTVPSWLRGTLFRNGSLAVRARRHVVSTLVQTATE